MNKNEIKKLFWKIVNQVDGCSDCRVDDGEGNAVERGMLLSNNYCVLFGLEDGILRIYDDNHNELMRFTDESYELIALKELFEILEDM